MTYMFSYEVPGNPQVYAAVKAEIGPTVPRGLIAQLVLQVEHGLQHLMVWETPEDWDDFRTARVEPAVRHVLAASGIPAPSQAPAATALELVDIWLPGADVPAAQAPADNVG